MSTCLSALKLTLQILLQIQQLLSFLNSQFLQIGGTMTFMRISDLSFSNAANSLLYICPFLQCSPHWCDMEQAGFPHGFCR